MMKGVKMNNHQWLVRTFMSTYVPVDLRKKFLDLMYQWDGSPSVSYAFYDFDVLYQKLIQTTGK